MSEPSALFSVSHVGDTEQTPGVSHPDIVFHESWSDAGMSQQPGLG